MIGIIGAMGVEIKALDQMLQNRESETISGIEYLRGTIHGKDVVLAVCGIGKVFAAVCAQTMILKYAPDVIINTGVAGTLTDCLSIGDIALSEDVVQHDMDSTSLGHPAGLISGINMVKIPADTQTLKAIAGCIEGLGINYRIGTIASGDKFLASQEIKQKIVNTFGAIAGEMEGGAIGHVCYINGVKFCVLRAISDRADELGPENCVEFLEQAAQNAVNVIDVFLKKSGNYGVYI